MKEQSKQKSIWVLTPIFGILVFVILYIVAALLYPGGSQADKNSIGFSWVNNYWCNLLNEKAINNQYNSAKPFAVAAMLVLCFTLSLFWFLFAKHMQIAKRLKLIIQISGTLSMVSAFLLLANINHDLAINIASSLGVIATIGAFIGLYTNKLYFLFAFGLLIILLVGLNNYFYYTNGLIIYLPVIQKISFAAFLIWICCIDIILYRRS